MLTRPAMLTKPCAQGLTPDAARPIGVVCAGRRPKVLWWLQRRTMDGKRPFIEVQIWWQDKVLAQDVLAMTDAPMELARRLVRKYRRNVPGNVRLLRYEPDGTERWEAVP